MSWGPLLVNLVVTAGLVAVLMLATFLYAMRTRVHAILDTVWPLGFVLIALVSFLLSAGSGVTGRRVLVLVLTAIWGLRLGAHIYTRNRGQGEDKRYASLLRRNRGNLAAFVLRYIYWMHYAEGSAMPPLLLKLVARRLESAKMPFFAKPIARRIAQTMQSSFIDPQLRLHFGYIDAELAKSPWFAGDAFSAADVQMSFPLEAGSHRAGAKNLPHIRAFLERIHARPAYRRALERGGRYDYAS